MAFLRRFSPSDALALTILSIWAPLYFWPAALGEQVFAYGDISQFSFPAGLALAHALAEGRLPLWEPAMQAGYPLLAAGNVTALYPINLLLYRFLPFPLALDYVILFHLAWGSIGMYAFARVVGRSVPGAWLAGFAFGFSGFALAHISHVALTTVAAWLPWLLLLQEKFWRAREAKKYSAHWLGLTAGAIGLQLLGGFTQLALYSLAIFSFLGTFRPLLTGSPVPGRLRNRLEMGKQIVHAAGWTFVPIILGVGIAAIQLVPTAELTEFSIRAQVMDPEFITSFSLTPEALSQFVSPFGWLGEPDILDQEFWAYFGIISLLLALLAPFLRRDAQTIAFVLLAVIALALAVGKSTPLYSLVAYIPVVNRFRAPARFLYILVFTASWLAGTSFDALRARLSATPRRQLSGRLYGGVSILVALGLIWLNAHQSISWLGVWQILPGIFGLIGVGATFLAWRRTIRRDVFTAVIVGSTVLDMTLFAFPFLTTLDRTVPPSELTVAPPSITVMDTTHPLYRLFTNVFNETFRPNHPMVYGKQSAQIYNPLPLRRGEEYLSQLSAQMLNLLNVRYYVLPNGPLPEGFEEPTASVKLDLVGDQIDIPPTRATEVQIASYTDETSDLPDDFLVGEITLRSAEGGAVTLPIRMGHETADWAYSALGDIQHSKPDKSEPFAAYSISIRRQFVGFKYIAHYAMPASFEVVSISGKSYLPEYRLTIERVVFLDERGQSTSLAALAHRNNLATVFKSHADTVLENQDVLPRAFVLHAAEFVSDEDIFARLRDPNWEPNQLVFLADTPPLLPSRESGGTPPDKAAIAHYLPERVEVEVEMGAPGYLILTDTWYPGWEAFVDGVKTQIYRADYIFRAVPIQSGRHTVVFEYHPLSLAIGAWITGLTLIVTAGLVIRGLGNNVA